jgi:hypothetical protein
MKSACRGTSLIAMSLVALGSSAAAAAPVSVDGWRYVEGPNELHLYVCDRSDCVPGSRVFLHFDRINSAVFPGIFRKWEAAVSDTLGEPSKVFSPFAIDLLTGQMHGVATVGDGSKTYYSFGDADVSSGHASLSSSSPDEMASQANLKQFEAALKSSQK